MSLKQPGLECAIAYAMWHSALPPEGYPSRLPNSAIGVLNGANSSVSKTQNWLREMSAGQVRFSSYSLVGITGRSWWSRVRLLVQCAPVKYIADIVRVAPCHSISGGFRYGSTGERGSPWRLYSGFGGEKS